MLRAALGTTNAGRLAIPWVLATGTVERVVARWDGKRVVALRRVKQQKRRRCRRSELQQAQRCHSESSTELTMKPCALCGEAILDNPSDLRDEESAEHVPPRQFFPASMRTGLRQPLWKVPSHRRCNESYKSDEEYFFHCFYSLVGVQNPPMGQTILNELRRRARKPQTRGLIRRVLKETTHTTPSGLLLPPGWLRVNYNAVRIENVVVKVAKCLFYKDHARYMPKSACAHIERCDSPAKLQPVFAELVRCDEVRCDSAAPDIFRYWQIEIDGQHLYALLF